MPKRDRNLATTRDAATIAWDAYAAGDEIGVDGKRFKATIEDWAMKHLSMLEVLSVGAYDNAVQFRQDIGVEIGVNVLEFSDSIDNLAAVSGTNKLLFMVEPGIWSLVNLTGGLTFADGNLSVSITQYTDEMAQDAVGNILTDTSTINFTYDDAGGAIKADVQTGSISLAMMANLAKDTLIGRSTGSTGVPETIACTAAGRALIDDADAAAQRTTLGLAIGTNVQAYSLILSNHQAAPVNVASGSTTNVFAAASDNVFVTGTTTITAFDTVAAGLRRKCRMEGALILTYHATNLIIPGGANITTAAGDTFEVLSLGSGHSVLLWYTRANGQAVIVLEDIQFACSAKDTDIETGEMVGLPAPCDFVLLGVFIACDPSTPPTDADAVFDLNNDFSTVLGTKITLEDGSNNSLTAIDQPTITSPNFVKGDWITVDADQIGATDAGQNIICTLNTARKL